MSSRPSTWFEIATEIGAAIVLSVAALLTSWASFQAALWDGEQAAAYTQAGAARVEAGLLATESGQSEAIDLFLFTQWLNAKAEEKAELQNFYRTRFRPEFARAFEAWLELHPLESSHAPPSPFSMPEYEPRHAREARTAGLRADALFAQGQRNNEISDGFVQATVAFALALFLGGIGQTFRREMVRALFSLLGMAACVLGAVGMLVLPTLSL